MIMVILKIQIIFIKIKNSIRKFIYLLLLDLKNKEKCMRLERMLESHFFREKV
jgi:hypothetical protein